MAPLGMRALIGLLVVLVAFPVFAEPTTLNDELVRRRRELDRLEQTWADFTTEGAMQPDVVPAVLFVAEACSVRTKLLVQLEARGLQRRYYRQVYAARLEATMPALRCLLHELSELRVPTNVRDLHLRARGSAPLDVSFSLIVYENAALMVDAVLQPRRPGR